MPLFITEFSGQSLDANGVFIPSVITPSLADQTVAVGASSVQSAAFNSNTRVVRLSSDVVCSVKFGSSPTATTTTMRLPANSVEYFGVAANTVIKVAVIANS